MSFFERLQHETRREQQELLAVPIIQRALAGAVSLDDYVSFLCQAYHHVKHTVPLLMAAGCRLSGDHEWLRQAVARYIEEEIGHQEWILDDISACGFDSGMVRCAAPSMATELMVSFAYDMIQRVDPLGFFGMVHVLEGTSTSIACRAADSIQSALALPVAALSYLYSHGALDIEHVRFFESLMNRIDDDRAQRQIVHSARVFYKLYGDVFRTLTPEHGIPRTGGNDESV